MDSRLRVREIIKFKYTLTLALLPLKKGDREGFNINIIKANDTLSSFFSVSVETRKAGMRVFWRVAGDFE